MNVSDAFNSPLLLNLRHRFPSVNLCRSNLIDYDDRKLFCLSATCFYSQVCTDLSKIFWFYEWIVKINIYYSAVERWCSEEKIYFYISSSWKKTSRKSIFRSFSCFVKVSISFFKCFILFIVRKKVSCIDF